MQIREIMTQKVITCHQDTNLAEAATIMWDNDCGVVPVVDDENQVLGLLTDRDICMAVATKNRLACDIKAGEIISRKVYGCAPDENVDNALKIMELMQVRRIPIFSKDHSLQGILSLNDLILKAEKSGRHDESITYDKVMHTLKGVSESPKQDWKEQSQTA